MAYLISDIRGQKPQPGYRYLFDTNVWLAVLFSSTYGNHSFKPYITFFNSIISQTKGEIPRLAVPSMLISEIVNRALRDINFKEYQRKHPEIDQERNPYKAYRKTDQGKVDLNIVAAEIKDYHRHIEFISDNLAQYSCKDLLKNIPPQLDFNDFIYTKIAAEQGLVIVTNDSDFDVEDVTILTTQVSLLNLAKPVNG